MFLIVRRMAGATVTARHEASKAHIGESGYMGIETEGSGETRTSGVVDSGCNTLQSWVGVSDNGFLRLAKIFCQPLCRIEGECFLNLRQTVAGG